MLKKISRIFFSFILVLGTVAALAACGNKVQAVAESLAITTAPTKTEYIEGETFDPTGIVLTLTYDDGSTKALSANDYTYDLTRALKTTDKNVTFTYTEGEDITLSVKQKIKVTNNVTNIVVKTQPTQTSYMSGETFNPAGLVLEATYQNGKTETITPAADELDYSKNPLMGDETSVEVKYGGKSFNINITFARGVFIEAETGIINSSSGKPYNDAVGLEDQYNATGGEYVGDMKANDSVTFAFESDTAGKGDIAFRLASQYLKQDSNWTPIWMGDCQFNKICEFYVNGVKYNIPDEAILPGGGEENGEPNQNLWFNWREVTFEDIDFIEGINQIELKFIAHDYTDTSQSGFSGKFTANIDSLKVTSAECNVKPYIIEPEPPAPESDYVPTFTAVKIANEGDKAIMTVSGTVEGFDTVDAWLAENWHYDFQQNGYAVTGSWNGPWGYVNKDTGAVFAADLAAGTFTIKFDVTDIDPYIYTTHLSVGVNPAGGDNAGEAKDIKLDVEYDETITIGSKTYNVFSYPGADADKCWGCIGLKIDNASEEQPSDSTPVDPSTADIQLVKGSSVKYEVENATPANWKNSGFGGDATFVGEDASASGGKFVTSSTGDTAKSGTFSFKIYVPEDGKVTLTACYSQADGKKDNTIPMDRTFKIMAGSTEFVMTSGNKDLAPIPSQYDWRTFTYEAELKAGVHTITVSVKENTSQGCPCIDYFSFAI